MIRKGPIPGDKSGQGEGLNSRTRVGGRLHSPCFTGADLTSQEMAPFLQRVRILALGDHLSGPTSYSGTGKR